MVADTKFLFKATFPSLNKNIRYIDKISNDYWKKSQLKMLNYFFYLMQTHFIVVQDCPLVFSLVKSLSFFINLIFNL